MIGIWVNAPFFERGEEAAGRDDLAVRDENADIGTAWIPCRRAA
jgi:hypothetical protein